MTEPKAEAIEPAGTDPGTNADWQRPPFEPGHMLSVRHGAHSDALVTPEAEALLPVVLENNVHLDQARDRPALVRYAMILSRIFRVYRWLEQQEDAVFDVVDEGTIHAAYENLRRWEKQAEAAEEKLAISPAARVRHGIDHLRAAALTEEQEREQRDARKRLDERVAGLDNGAARPDPRTAP